MHKAIAIQRITDYLADHPAHAGVVNPANLPNRTAAAAGALAIGGIEDYRDYANFITNAAYNEAEINAFVVEACARIAASRAGVATVDA